MKRHLKKAIEKAYKTNWIVYSQQALEKAENVVKYLGQYAHRMAISNNRILNITDTHVKFIAKDYRDNGKKKTAALKGEEFLGVFVNILCQIVL